MKLSDFKELVSHGPVILDGATGSNLRKAGMPVGICQAQWILEHSDIVLNLKKDYIAAGSRIIYAPNFSANRTNLAIFGQENRMEEYTRRLVRLAQEASGGRAYIAGELTTTGRFLEPRGDMTYLELFNIYQEQIGILADSGVDLLVAETMMSLDETVVALEAAQSVCDLPVMCSLTMESDGQLLAGGSAVEAVETLQELGAAAVGLNCSVGPDQLESVISAMKAVAKVPIIAKPNAGMPVMDEYGMAHYSMSPKAFGAAMKKLVWRGARLVGGCCGTDPEYIRQLAVALGQ